MTTAYCFDPEHVRHHAADHPERPERLEAIMTALRDSGLLDRLLEVVPITAPFEAIQLVHPEEYILTIEATCLQNLGRLDLDTYVTEASFRVARRALGGLLNIVDEVMAGKADNGFALIRPPGHHARPFAAMGFCLFGNVAAAARHAQRAHGIERVLVVDFDVHHGNGTQEMFYDDPSVLVFSSHQYPCYPGTGTVFETGVDRGEGFTVNLPYPPGTGDKAFVDAHRDVLLPLAARFRPQLVLVAAGFDGHHLDPLANADLSAGGFAETMRLLLQIADEHCAGRLIATLEGGYHLSALAESVQACLSVMLDPSKRYNLRSEDGPDLLEIVGELKRLHGFE